MSLVFFGFGHRIELAAAGSHGQGARMAFRNHRVARQMLIPLWEQDRGLHRLRGFLAWDPAWRGTEKRGAAQVIDRVAEALCRGRLLMLSTPIRLQGSTIAPKRPEAAPESEEWIEIAPEPEPVEAEEGFAVSPGSAQALADSNRELAATGAPLKEICAMKDCTVCQAQLALGGAYA